MLEPDWKLLLLKYVANVAASEGPDFALSCDIAPCGMLNMEFADSEKEAMSVIFSAAAKWRSTLSKTQRDTLPLSALFGSTSL